MKILVCLIFSFAVMCVAEGGKNKQGNNQSAEQLSQPRQHVTARTTPTPTPKPTATPKPTNSGNSADANKKGGKNKGTPTITDDSTGTNHTSGTGKKNRTNKGKPVTTDTTATAAVTNNTPIPAASAPASTATPEPLKVSVTQLPTPTVAPVTTQTKPINITGQPQFSDSVIPNSNTTNPTQTGVSISGSNAVANQQPGSGPTGIQGQVVATQPTSSRAPTQLEVTTVGDASKGLDQIQKQPATYEITGFKPSTNGPSGSMEPIVVKHDAVGFDPIPSANPSSPFKNVTVTNPNPGPITFAGQHTDVHGSLGPPNSYQPVDTGGYLDMNALQHQFDMGPSAIGNVPYDWRTRNVTTTDNGENTAAPIYNFGENPTKDASLDWAKQWDPKRLGTDK
jgi:hypothetical protein